MENIKIQFGIEPIVKLECMARKCVHSLPSRCASAYCNKKYITLDDDGKCSDYKERGQ